MKSLLAVIAALSLAANLVLVGILFAGRSGSDDRTAAAAGAKAEETAARVKEAPPIEPIWEKISADELPASVQKLRDAGFPPHIVRAIVQARVQELFAARFKALRPDAAQIPYWKNASVDIRQRAAELQLYREQQRMLRDLLGPDAESPDSNVFQRHKLDSIPGAKHEAVKDALRLMDERRQEIYSTAISTITPDMQRRVAALEKDLQATLAGILTPSELEEFNIRNSESSQSLRYELAAFNPTEQEFRAMYQIWSKLEQPAAGLSPEEMQRRFEAQRTAKEQIKALLPPDRAAEYDRAIDHSFRQTSQLVSRLELPPETTVRVWEVKQDIEKRANDLRRDGSLAPDVRSQQLAALSEEGTKRVTALVGARGIEAYKLQGGGYWLQNLVPRPPPTAPSTSGATPVRRGP